MKIALSGFAGAGKDEAAKVLVNEYCFTRIAFADPMREAMYALDPWVSVCGGHVESLSAAVDRMGWDKAKREYTEIRRLLQVFGTEVGREMFGANFWVDLAMRNASQFERVVFTDCRFENEAQAVREAGGQVWRITRPGVGPVNGHVSDKGLPDALVDRTIHNEGSVEDLAETIRQVMETL